MSARSLGVLTLDLVAKIGGFMSSMQQAERGAKDSLGGIESHADKASNSIKELLTTAAGMATAGALFSKFIQNSRDAEQEQAQLAAALKSTREAAGFNQQQLNDMADSLSRNITLLSGGEINQAQTTLLAFTGIVGDQFPRALQGAIDMSARTGMSVVSAAETIGRALDVPSQGLTALSKQGFRFTEDQKKLAKQFEDTGRKAEAQAIILGALEESYGGAAKAARDTFTGSLTALGNTVDDLMTGDDSLVGATAAINALNDAMGSDGAKEFVGFLTGTALSAGLGYLAGGMISLTKSTIENIAATSAKIFTDQAALHEAQALTGAALLQARSNAAATASEVALAEAQLRAAVTAADERAAKILLTEAKIKDAAATAASTAAQEAHNKAMTAGRISAGGLLGVLTGPVGLAVTLGLTAASFMLMSDSSDTATDSLDDNKKSAADLAKEYLTLSAAQAEIRRGKLADELKKNADEAERAVNGLRGLLLTNSETMDVKSYDLLSQTIYQVSQNAISGDDALKRLKASGRFDKDLILEVAKYADQHDVARKNIEGGTSALNLLNANQEKLKQIAKGATSALTEQGNAAQTAAGQIGALTGEIAEYFEKLGQSKKSALIETALLGQGYGVELSKRITEATLLAHAQGKRITGEQVKAIEEGLQAEQTRNRLVEKANENEKKRLELLKKQSEFIQINARTLAMASKYNFASTEEKYNLPAGLLTAVADQESRGNSRAVSSVGAQGPFQFMPATARRFSLANPFDPEQAKEAAGKYLSWLFNRYKDWNKALTAYHSGEGNVDKGNIGPVGQKYGKEVLGRLAVVNGAKFNPNSGADFADYIDQQKDFLKAASDLANQREQIEYDLASELEKATQDRNKKLAEIETAFFDSPETRAKLKAKVNDQYAIEKAGIEQRQKQLQLDIDEQVLSAEQLVQRKLEITKLGIQASKGLTEQQRNDATRNAQKLADDELDILKQSKADKLAELGGYYADEYSQRAKAYEDSLKQIKDQYKNDPDFLRQAQAAATSGYIKSGGTGERLKSFAMPDQRTDQDKLIDDRDSSLFDTSQRYQNALDAAKDNYALQLEAKKAFEDEKAAIESEYSLKSVALAEKETEQKVAALNSFMGEASGVFGSLADIAKTAAGEQSSAYRAAFAISKAFAIAQSIMAIQAGIAQAAATPFPYNLAAMASVAAATASIVGNIQAVSMIGQAHDGIMEVPKSGTWNLEKGERVLTQKTAAKLDRTLDQVKSGGGSSGGVTVNIKHDPSLIVTARDNGNGVIDIEAVRSEIDRRAPQAVANDMAGHNSVTRKALTRNFQVAPNR